MIIATKKFINHKLAYKRNLRQKTYFCNKSCHCSWKNKHRKKNIWRPWCNSSTTRCGRVREDANSFGLPKKYFLKLGKKNLKSQSIKRPSKKVLKNLYWKDNYSQMDIANLFNVAHASVKRWLIYYKIPVKPRTLSCGKNPNSLKNLELGKTEEVERKSAESRIIYSREKLIGKIKEFVQEEGRVPTKNEFAKNPLYPNYATYQSYFGSWNKGIIAAGYKPNEMWFVLENSRNLQAKDGHLCNSVSEIIIDDWLFKNNIKHKREYLYPEGKCRCDFVISGIFIEFFGLANTNLVPEYNNIMERKRKLCKRYNIPLVELYEKDLHNLDKSLNKRLEDIEKGTFSIASLLPKLQSKFF